MQKQYLKIITKLEDMLTIKDFFDDEAKPRLIVGTTIRDYFDKIIINSNGYEENLKTTYSSLESSSHQNILRNYKTFDEKLQEYLKGFDINKHHEPIIKLIKYLCNIEIIQINVTDDVAAYEIFETVNSKNEPLTSSDLIKNQILRSLDDKDIYEQKWNNSIANVNQIEGFNFNQFLRYFWLSKYGWSTDKKLYANFKSHLKSLESKPARTKFLRNFLDEIVENSLYLRRLINPGYDDFFTKYFHTPQNYDQTITHSLKTIKSLNIKQCYVLLMSMLRNVVKTQKKFKDPKRFGKIPKSFSIMIKQVETFSLFFHTLAKGQANKVEKTLYHNYAIEIEEYFNYARYPGDTKTLKTWNNIIKDQLILKLERILKDEDIDLNNILEKLDYTKPIDYFVIKYVFEKINQFNYGGKSFSFNENATVEHILPRSPSKWKLKIDSIAHFVNKIGNLTIIERDLNKALGNETLYKKLTGIEYNGKINHYFQDKCNYNVELFTQMKTDLEGFNNEGHKYWTEKKINERSVMISEEFKEAIKKYNSK